MSLLDSPSPLIFLGYNACILIIFFVICLPTEHLGVLKNSLKCVSPCVPVRIGIWKCWFLRRGENRSTRRKISRSKGENQQRSQPTYGFDARIRIRSTLVGGLCSHHCTTLAPPRSQISLCTPRFLCRERSCNQNTKGPPTCSC